MESSRALLQMNRQISLRHAHLRDAQQAPHGPDFILEEFPEGLDELKLQVLGQAADVMMAFDGVAVLLPGPWGWARLDDVGV